MQQNQRKMARESSSPENKNQNSESYFLFMVSDYNGLLY